MDSIRNIVVVVHRSADARFVMEKAAAVVQTSGDASVHVVRVIYEEFVDQTHIDGERDQALKLFLMQAEEEFLEDLVAEYRDQFADIETVTLWNKRISNALISVVDTFTADLIIKSAEPDREHAYRHPDDWNLLRNTHCPVFLVNAEPWPEEPGILAAVDVADKVHEDMNAKILATAENLSQASSARLCVLSVVPKINTDVLLAQSGIDFEQVEREAIQRTRTQLGDLLAKSSLTLSEPDQLIVKAGSIVRVVAQVAKECGASIVIVGTAGRKGAEGELIGNTSEALLHRLPQDLLVLPA